MAIKRGATLLLPLELHNHTDAAKNITIAVKLPEGWTTQSGVGNLSLDPQSDYYWQVMVRSEEHTSELQSRRDLVCRLLLEKKKKKKKKKKIRNEKIYRNQH